MTKIDGKIAAFIRWGSKALDHAIYILRYISTSKISRLYCQVANPIESNGFGVGRLFLTMGCLLKARNE